MDSVPDGIVRDAIMEKLGEGFTTSCYAVVRTDNGYYGPRVENTLKVFMHSGDAHREVGNLNTWMKNNNLHADSIRTATSGGAWLPPGFSIVCGAVPSGHLQISARMISPFSGMISLPYDFSSGLVGGLYYDLLVSGMPKELSHLFTEITSGEHAGQYTLNCPDPDYRYCSRGVDYRVRVMELHI